MNGRLAILLLLPLAASCVASPQRRQPELDFVAPATWTSAPVPGAEAGRRWWDSFGDPRIDELVDRARRNNQDLRATLARVEQAAAQARIAGADLKPTLSLGLDGSRRRQNFIGLPIPNAPEVLSNTTTSLSLGVTTTWEADVWGRVRASTQAALADFEAIGLDRDALLMSIEARTVKAWFQAIAASMQVELARSTTESLRDSAGIVRRRYEAGVRSALDLRLALANLARVEAAEQARAREQDLAIRRLEVLLGSYPSGTLPLADGLPDTPTPVDAGLPADLVSRRPDLVAAERRLAAADARLVSARRSLYPRLSLTASGGTASNELRDLLDGDFRIWSLVANLAQPLFQGGRLRAGVDGAEAGTRAAVAEYTGVALQAFSEVESALSSETFLAGREDRLAEATRQSRAAERLALDRYRKGLVDYITVLDSQTRALESETALIGIRLQRLENRVDLHLALGGGFQAPEGPLRLEDVRDATAVTAATFDAAPETDR